MNDLERVTAGEIERHLRFRAQLSVAGIVILGAIGLTAITISAGHIDGYRAVFSIGIALCICAFTMIIGWGASSNHAQTARLISDEFSTVEKLQRETGNAVVVALDEVRRRRARREG